MFPELNEHKKVLILLSGLPTNCAAPFDCDRFSRSLHVDARHSLRSEVNDKIFLGKGRF
jgi:hypothetical protein